MTKNAVQSFMTQAEEGQIRLFPDVHGIKDSDDIAILTKARILPDGDWFTEFRLFDEHDGIGANKLEKVDHIWKQAKGLPPYKKPIQKGFSIEGYIPDEAILQADKDEFGNLSRRVIDDVLLDGAVLVPRPAYKDSIANACYKALGEMHPIAKDKLQKNIQSKFREIVNDNELKDQYHRKKWEIQNALDETLEDIMKKNNPEKEDQLNLAFDEYKDMMIGVIMQSESIFTSEEDEGENINAGGIAVTKSSKLEVLKSLLNRLQHLERILKSKGGKGNVKK